MKRNGFLFALSLLIIVSCSKYDKILNTNWGEVEIDGNMNWGIPLINADYSVEKILTQFSNMKYIETDPNGNYFINFTKRKEEHLNASHYNHIHDTLQAYHLNFPKNKISHTFNPFFVQLVIDDVKIYEAIFKSGQIKFDFSNVIPPVSNYEIEITSKRLLNNDGTPFKKMLPKGTTIADCDCKGLKITTDNNQIDFTTTIILDQVTSISLDFYPKISLTNIILQYADIEILKEQAHAFITTSDFLFLFKGANADIILQNPRLVLNVTNTFGSAVDLVFSKAYFHGNTHTETILLNDNVQVEVTPNTESIDMTPYVKNKIQLLSEYDYVQYECVINIPKGKRIKFYDHSIIETEMNFIIPFDIVINEATFSDTVAFNLPDIKELSMLDTVKMRMAFESSIPIDFGAQVLFYNSAKKEVVDSLLITPMKINGAYSNHSVLTPARYITITENKLKKLQQANELILHLRLETNEKHKLLNQKNNLVAKVGAQIISQY